MKDLNIPLKEEKKISKAIDDMLPDEEIIKEIKKVKCIKILDSIFEFIIFKVVFGYFDWVALMYQKIESFVKHAKVQY